MNRGALIRLAVLLTLAAPAAAQNALEIISLRHRTAEQVIPALEPILDVGATLSGKGSQLFVRTSPANLVEVRRMLEDVDRPQKRLVISVRFDNALDASSREVGVKGRISDRGSSVDVRARDSATQAQERVDQRVQAVDGGRALILTGASRPVSQRQYIQTPAGVVSQQVTVTQETTAGFEVIPRVAGNRVEVQIAGQRPGSAVATTASGRLGEWFQLGQVAITAGGGETRRVWVRVDEAP
jgi:hypothetical protein